ncbi:putative nucleosome assembly protein [Yarrowia sp. B02]|nr:putative nucleosome assembly protein [Yarrowia sp. B02]
MSEPIKSKRIEQLSSIAPTPQNTPASNASSFLQRAANPGVSTIAEDGQGEVDLGALSRDPALLSHLAGRLNQMAGTSSGYVDSLPLAVRRRIDGLKALHQQASVVEDEFHKEMLELERKFQAKFAPIYADRAAVIGGEKEVTEEQVEAGKKYEQERMERMFGVDGDDVEEDEDDEDEDAKEEKEEKEGNEPEPKGIPYFWLTAIQNLPGASGLISERDSEALKALLNVRMEYLKDKPGFVLIFDFAENEFFTNKQLKKSYFYLDKVSDTGELMYDHAEGDEIDWKSPEQNLTMEITKRKQRNKHTKATRIVEKAVPTESFFTFFSPPKALDEEEEDEDEEVDHEERDNALQLDYQIGEEIKEQLIPRAVDWFTGFALEMEMEHGDMGEFEDEDDDEDDDDEDDDDEDDEEGGKKEAQECKQS